jgi:hypothetical protein
MTPTPRPSSSSLASTSLSHCYKDDEVLGSFLAQAREAKLLLLNDNDSATRGEIVASVLPGLHWRDPQGGPAAHPRPQQPATQHSLIYILIGRSIHMHSSTEYTVKSHKYSFSSGDYLQVEKQRQVTKQPTMPQILPTIARPD